MKVALVGFFFLLATFAQGSAAGPIYVPFMSCTTRAMDANIVSIVQETSSGSLLLKSQSTWIPTLPPRFFPMELMRNGHGVMQYKAGSATITVYSQTPDRAVVDGYGPHYECAKP